MGYERVLSKAHVNLYKIVNSEGQANLDVGLNLRLNQDNLVVFLMLFYVLYFCVLYFLLL